MSCSHWDALSALSWEHFISWCVFSENNCQLCSAEPLIAPSPSYVESPEKWYSRFYYSASRRAAFRSGWPLLFLGVLRSFVGQSHICTVSVPKAAATLSRDVREHPWAAATAQSSTSDGRFEKKGEKRKTSCWVRASPTNRWRSVRVSETFHDWLSFSAFLPNGAALIHQLPAWGNQPNVASTRRLSPSVPFIIYRLIHLIWWRPRPESHFVVAASGCFAELKIESVFIPPSAQSEVAFAAKPCRKDDMDVAKKRRVGITESCGVPAECCFFFLPPLVQWHHFNCFLFAPLLPQWTSDQWSVW